MELPIEDYINKLLAFEKCLGAEAKYEILEPFPLRGERIIATQSAAKNIAEFVGLQNLHFIVSVVKQDEKVGGHIELEYGPKEVFIEISENTAEFDAAILATLAHEITHKYLQIKAISVGPEAIHKYENEILTDVGTVFLGLGKLMLNGCISENVQQEFYGDVVRNQLKIGYLNRQQLAFVYRITCAMRGIAKKDVVSGLCQDAIWALNTCNTYQERYFNPQFRTPQYRNELVAILEENIYFLQNQLSQISRHIDIIKKRYIRKTEDFLKTNHKETVSLLSELKSMKKDDIYDPCLLFLDSIGFKNVIDRLKGKVERQISDTVVVRRDLNELTKLEQSEELRKSRTKPSSGKILSRIFKRKPD